jgi:hypothetical protein
VEVIDPISIDFVSSKDYGRIMARKYRISVCKCLLKKLDTYGSVSKINCPFFSTLHIAKCISSKMHSKRTRNGTTVRLYSLLNMTEQ